MNANTKRRQRQIRKQRRADGIKPGSVSEAKNLEMVVLHNEDANGKKFSVTRFHKLNTSGPEYRRFKLKAA